MKKLYAFAIAVDSTLVRLAHRLSILLALPVIIRFFLKVQNDCKRMNEDKIQLWTRIISEIYGGRQVIFKLHT